MEEYVVNLDDGTVTLVPDGDVVPIIKALDHYGEDCDYPLAVVVVAGPLPSGQWLTIELDETTDVVLH